MRRRLNEAISNAFSRNSGGLPGMAKASEFVPALLPRPSPRSLLKETWTQNSGAFRSLAYKVFSIGQLGAFVVAALAYGALDPVASDHASSVSLRDTEAELGWRVRDPLNKPSHDSVITYFVVESEERRAQLVLGINDKEIQDSASGDIRFEVLVASTPEQEARVLRFLHSLRSRWQHPDVRLEIVDLRQTPAFEYSP